MISLEKAKAKMVRNLRSAGESYTDGVDGITEHPGEAAARNGEGYLAGVQNSYQKWRQNVVKMPLIELKNRMKGKGVRNLTASAEEAANTWAKGVGGFWYNFIQQLKEEVRRMPAVTAGDRDARAEYWRRRMREAAAQQV